MSRQGQEGSTSALLLHRGLGDVGYTAREPSTTHTYKYAPWTQATKAFNMPEEACAQNLICLFLAQDGCQHPVRQTDVPG